MMPTIERAATQPTDVSPRNRAFEARASGQSGSENLRNPYVPIFRRTPARMTEPAVGASTCASGSQVWNGNIGTLIAKPMKNAQKSQSWRSGGIEEAIAWKWTMSNVPGFPRPFHHRKPEVLKK